MNAIAERLAPLPDGTIKILIIDDSPIDAELATMEFRRAGVATECVIAADKAELTAALTTFAPDVILCDVSFPGFDGFTAQRIVRKAYPKTPLIFVSGTISEDRAVTALQSGAVDYVLKSNLTRLASAVQRAVRDARERKHLEGSLEYSETRARIAAEQAEERSRQHAERLEELWRLVNDPSLREEELWLAMLGQAAAAIWPGQASWGNLWRVGGTNLIVEALSDSSEPLLSDSRAHAGSIIPMETTAIGRILREGGGARSWDDIQASDYSSALERESGTRAFVVTTFIAGGATWGVSFSSAKPTSKPLGPNELAYVEVLASFFANHVQQRWQFERIQYQESHDILTGLLNRSQFRSQVGVATRASSRFGVILVDVNDFHEINESYGTTIGDALLVEIGNALLKRASRGEMVGRVGGDVFAVYVANPISLEFLRSRALVFAQVFAHSFATGEREGKGLIARTACLGVSLAPEDGSDIDAILSHADAALFAAKELGHGSVIFYEAGMEANAQHRAALRNEIGEAIGCDQFTLYYQPHIEVSTGEVTGCEALIRWNHPVRGLLAPSHFIPFAEQSGIITSIDAWVMRRAFADARELSAGRPGFRLFFNLSGRQAGDPKLIRAFTHAARNGVALSNIGVEITESDAMRDVEATRRVCRALRRLGVQIAIDDFGTGYSSLSFLKRLPIDIVKIDRSFVSELLSDPHDQVITETIISIAERFGFKSLAEGVERPEELEWLRQRCCRYAQGFAICHPLPLGGFTSWLAARSA
ncbi:MAG TPA: GGDEF domain-containing response regulator [Candidatus Tumulicola sp.]|nr:GGDEF domain-containing response regulator [Candidatus Tumulicola sp.]